MFRMIRDYNPSTGRYMQSEPLGLEAGFNTYAYVGNNPYRAVDPYGLLQSNKDGSQRYDHSNYGIFSHPSGYYSIGSFALIYANDGTKIVAYKNTFNDVLPKANTNCHGYSFARGEYWVDNSQVNKILSGDGYKKIGGGVYEIRLANTKKI